MNDNLKDNLNHNPQTIKTTKVVYPQVYAYTLPDLVSNEGSQKIGYTERSNVDARIYEQTHTAAIQLRPEKLWSAPAFFSDSAKDFSDKAFHQFLRKNNVENRLDLGKEWFYFNGTPERSKQLFDTFRGQGFAALQGENNKIPYVLRSEQNQAVEQAKQYYETHENGEFLWNAKPRFGKTLASYDLAKRLGANKVLIVTNRPAIANSWFDDFELFVDGYYFISDTSSLAERKSITREQYNQIDTPNKNMITFLSLQDLKGSKFFGGSHDKLQWVADLEWDLLIIDEAHEGVDTGRTDAAFTIVKRKHTLYLSGTPFKALANQKFANDAIFNWTYLDEQKIKQAELEEGESGDHTDLPNLKLFTYRISQMIADEVNEGIEIDDQARDFAFDLNEFFATTNQKFDHETEVKDFLRNLTTNKKYPFSTPELRDQLRHTFWYVGNRVDSVKALEQLLKQDDVFKEYKIVVAAGDGRSFKEEESDFKANEKSFDKVKKAIAENPKTITLSCGQLTTGVTIKEWSAVLMLTDLKTPAQYMQAAFRVQNPYKFYENGELKVKQSAHLFDFAPTRVLEIYDQFANGLNGKAVNGEITESERKQNIKELLNFFPVISEDVNGQMVELDAEKVLTFPNALAATEIVKARFMTNLLFNDNIKNVFHFPKEVEAILDKMPIEKNKRAEVTKKELDLDDARMVEQDKQAKINDNSGVILGEKIYRTNIERVVDNAVNYETPEETLETLPGSVSDLIEPVIAKYKEVYKATNAEIEEIKKDAEEKIKLAVAEYENAEIKDADKLKQSLADIIERDIVQEKVEKKETAVVENVQKTKEDEVRDHLRAFTRTIPMFIMANSSREVITIDNFDEQISNEDFTDLTNITKAEFHMLRDGFDYEEAGERKTFGGVFDRYKFNASMAEFVAEKQKRADYFKTDDDIFELIPNQKNNQIFTPRRVVKMMVDGLENEQPELFQRTDSTFIDLYMKSGMYITEIVKKLFTNTKHHYNTEADCLRHILENQVYGLAPTDVLYGITTSYIFGFDVDHDISNHNFAMHDLLTEAKNGTAPSKLEKLFGNGGDIMKFDAVVGNPPYQEADGGGTGDSAKPVYNHFTIAAKSISDTVSLIMPSRWMKGGKGLDQFRKDMTSDNHIVSLYDFDDEHEVFGREVNIDGGVSYFLWDRSYTGETLYSYKPRDEDAIVSKRLLSNDSSDKVIRDNRQLSIIEKAQTDVSFSEIVSSRKPYGIGADFFNNPERYSIHTSDEMLDGYVKIYGVFGKKGGARRLSKFIPSRVVKSGVEQMDKYKLFFSKAYMTRSTVPPEVIIAKPREVCTETFLNIGSFDNGSENEACLKYIKSKFFRALLFFNRHSLNISRSSFELIPLQSFTEESDINWSRSIAEIDQQLYAKYGLDQHEIDFIELRVKGMA